MFTLDAYSIWVMKQTDNPFAPEALQRAVPRYTSYPTAPHFSAEISAETYARWLSELVPGTRLSLYAHIPFCDELCWFCACRTQGAKRYSPVTHYLGLLEREIEMVAAALDPAHQVVQMHWGGGSPTILAPEDIRRLYGRFRDAFPSLEGAEFAVEIDPRDVTEAKLDALAECGLARASIGVQDFEPAVQKAIGRLQGRAMTERVIARLRAHGVEGINIDFLYGLPGQTEETLARTIEAVVALGPDRLALFGYAHVPWMAKRQKMIDASRLPGPAERKAQAQMARRLLIAAGYRPIGIDHFAKPGDALAKAEENGALRRNFQGYTVDPAEALIGLGASAIGTMPQGYVQNEAATQAYLARVGEGRLPTARGVALGMEDRVRRAAIEEILCHFRLDIGRLVRLYGDFARPIRRVAADLVEIAPDGALEPLPGPGCAPESLAGCCGRMTRGFVIAPAWRDHTRLIAAAFDAYLAERAARHSVAL